MLCTEVTRKKISRKKTMSTMAVMSIMLFFLWCFEGKSGPS